MLKMSSHLESTGEWGDEELAMALYFSSCKIRQSTIALILAGRGYQRTQQGISLKLGKLSGPLRLNTGQWIRERVNEWILRRFTLEEASNLIVLGKEEQSLIARVS